MTHTIRIAGDLTEPVELFAQSRDRVSRHAVWKRLVDSGRVVGVGNG